MKKFYPSNMYLALYNGEHIVIKATGEDMEYMLRNDPKMSDYRLFEAYKLEKHEKMPVGR